MKILFLILSVLLVSKITIAQWQVISNQGDGEVFFVNDTLGFGLSKKSIDGGYSWQPMTTSTNGAIFFTDVNKGHMVHNTNTGPPTYQRSNDGGQLWTDMSTGFPSVYGATLLSFPVVDTGYAVLGGTVYKTIDTGNTWTTYAASSLFNANSLYFTSADTGFLGGNKQNTPYLFKTENGGISWDSVPLPFVSSTPFFFSVVFPATSQDIFAINTGDTLSEILYSSDGGNNWVSQYTANNLTFWDIHFSSKKTGYVTGYNYQGISDTGLVLKTVDGGNNWIAQATGYNKILFKCHFINDSVGWISGQNGDILHTNNGGQTVGINENIHRQPWMNFPNPFSIETTLKIEHRLNNATLFIANCSGQTVKKIKNISGKAVTLHRDNLPSGLYFIHLTENHKIIAAGKIIITD